MDKIAKIKGEINQLMIYLDDDYSEMDKALKEIKEYIEYYQDIVKKESQND